VLSHVERRFRSRCPALPSGSCLSVSWALLGPSVSHTVCQLGQLRRYRGYRLVSVPRKIAPALPTTRFDLAESAC
jgi:hypothetical protein